MGVFLQNNRVRVSVSAQWATAIVAVAIAVITSACEQRYSVTKSPGPALLEAVVTQDSSGIGPSGPSAMAYSSLSVLPSADFGKLPLGTQTSYIAHLRNRGERDAQIQSIAIEPASLAPNFTITPLCTVIPADSSELCDVRLDLSPQVLGDVDASLSIQYASSGQSQVDTYKLPLIANVNNLAFLKYEVASLNVGNDTIGYTASAFIKVIYNGAHIINNTPIQIKPAMGVLISDPSDSQFTINATGTTCGKTISADCLVQVNFTATKTGVQSSTLNLSYFNGAETLRIAAPVSGTGLTAVVLAKLTAGSGAFGNVVFNPAAPKVISIPINFSGSVPADGVTITGPTNTTFKIDSNPANSTCLSAASINGNCTLSVSFNPTARTSYSDTITIAYKSATQVQPNLTIALSGAGVNPAKVTVSPTALAFGSDPAYKPVNTQNFVLTNSGEVAISALSVVTASDATNFSYAFASGCSTLAASGTCNLTATFLPKSAGAMTSNVSFTYFDGRATQTVSGLSATGTGLAPAVFTGDNNVIDFGNIPMGAPASYAGTKSTSLGFYGTTKIVATTDLVGAPSQLSTPFQFANAQAFPGKNGTCVAPLDPATKNSCSINVELVTTSTGLTVDTPATQAFTLTYTGQGGQGTGVIHLTAKVTPRAPAVLAFTTTPSFGTLALKDSATATFVLTNQSQYVSGQISALGIAGGAGYTISSNTCVGTTLAAKATCNVVVQFNPTTAGVSNAVLSATYTDFVTAGKTATATLTGTGSADVRLAVSGSSSIDFGTIYVGDAPVTKTVTLKYFGGSTWTSSNNANSPFTIDASSCGGKADCVLSITYNPTVAASTNSSVKFTYAPAVNPTADFVSLTLIGVANARGSTIVASPLAFAKTLQGQTLDQVISIQNTGTASAQNFSTPSVSGDFSLQASDSSMSNPCTSSTVLAASATCQIKVRFSPSKIGAITAPLTFSYLDNGSGQSKNFSQNLTGTGTVQVRVFAGSFQSCIINELKQAICWGSNSYGQLGQGNANVNTDAPQNMAAIKLGSQSVVKSLAVGPHHICAIVDTPSRSGVVSCWGENSSGKLGLGSPVGQLTQPQLDSQGNPVGVDLGTDQNSKPLEAVQISAGFEHTCAVLNNGAAKCWGGNSSGQLGKGDLTPVGSAASDLGNNLEAIELGASVTSISAGAGHTCATLSGGTAKCWGDNFYGQLGQGANPDTLGGKIDDMTSLKAINLGAGLSAQTALASQGAASCIVLTNGSVKCFGKTVYNESTSTPFFGVLGACWARANYNSKAVDCATHVGTPPTTSLGYYTSDMGDKLPPVALGSTVISAMALGDHFSCVLGTDQSVRCWGSNDRGQLGIGSTLSIGESPADMGNALTVTLSSATSIAAGAEHACAALSNNTVKCWGSSTEKATGLKLVGISGDANSASTVAVIYDGKK